MEFALRTRKILGVLRNFRDHAAELGNPVPTIPTFFLKTTSSVIEAPHPIELPEGANVHHEIELGVVLRTPSRVRNVSEENAMDLVAGYFLALDLTARDIQAVAKAKGLPWAASKGLDTFCPVGTFIPRDQIPDPSSVTISLTVDGVQRQKDTLKNLVFGVPKLISHSSKLYTIDDYDIILTGTPAGVGPLVPGNRLVGSLEVDGKVISTIDFKCIGTPAAAV